MDLIERKEFLKENKLEAQVAPPTLISRYRDIIKKTVVWIRYTIFILIICVMIYSVIAAHLHPNAGAQKDHEQKVENVLQGLYKLIQMTNHFPILGPLGINADPLDDLNRNIESLLQTARNFTSDT